MMKKNSNKGSPDLRQKAEKLLSSNASKTVPQSEVEILKLLHELEVHQIELELQNEELILAKEQAESATEKYIELYDFAPSGYFTLSRDGMITRLNFAAAQMLGKDRSALINRRFGLFVSAETMDSFNLFLDIIYQNSTAAVCDVILTGVEKSPVNVNLSGTLSVNGEECLIIAIDITERKLIEKRLIESEEKWRRLFEILPVGVSVLDHNHEISDYNPALKTILDLSDSDFKNKKYAGRIYMRQDDTPVSPHEFPGFIAVKEQKTVRNMELQVLKEDGTVLWLDVSASPLPSNNSACVIVTVDITGRKIQEKRINDSRILIDSIINNTSDAITLKDVEGRYLLVNNSAEWLMGRSAAEITGRDDSSLFIPAESAIIMENDSKVLKTGGVHTFEEVLTVSTGRKLTFLSTKGVLCDDSGRVTGLYCISRDITNRKMIENALHKSQQDFSTLAENANDIIVRYNKDLRILYCNSAFEKQLEISCVTCFGKTLVETGLPVDQAELLNIALKKTLDSGSEQEIEHYYNSDAGRKFFQTRIVPEKDLKGKIQTLLALTRNITDHKKSELLLARYRDNLERDVLLRTAELRESENRYKEIINSITDYVYQVIIHDGNEVTTIYSETCYSVTGYHAAEFQDNPLLWIEIVYEDDREMVNNFIRSIITEHTSDRKLEHRIVHKDGTVLWIDNSIVIHRGINGELKGYDGVIRDISQRKAAEFEIISLNRHIIKLQEDERRHVAQDLHDGVGQTMLAAKISLDTYKLDPVRFENQLDIGLAFITRASSELREVYSGLYPTILNDLGLEMSLRWLIYNLLETTGIKVETSINILNRFQNELNVCIYRIMQEIVSNILKHADATKISINLLENDYSIALTVKDNGVGFNVNKFKKQISGYGLVNIKSRVKGFNGIMTIENNNPQGTVIDIVLNITPEDLA
ncbi:MAG: hypothetical protein CVV49_18925 [Spirochaetae bacterium HGW-Spirochaetae-5]|nr:MAG: hypothetical protein CVV49_18925 [Spirochaetae bacterium HGW-Spirochaetae-5]